jgi:hypothetical protein
MDEESRKFLKDVSNNELIVGQKYIVDLGMLHELPMAAEILEVQENGNVLIGILSTIELGKNDLYRLKEKKC